MFTICLIRTACPNSVLDPGADVDETMTNEGLVLTHFSYCYENHKQKTRAKSLPHRPNNKSRDCRKTPSAMGVSRANPSSPKFPGSRGRTPRPRNSRIVEKQSRNTTPTNVNFLPLVGASRRENVLFTGNRAGSRVEPFLAGGATGVSGRVVTLSRI